LTENHIEISEVPEKYWQTLNEEAKEPSEWDSLFAAARFSKLMGEELVQDLPKSKVDITQFYTQRKPRTETLTNLPEGDAEPDTWIVTSPGC
jgi:hypothetical protein